MKHGFRILIHKSLTGDRRKAALDMCAKKVQHFCSEGSYAVGYCGSDSYYRRGVFGLFDKDNNFTFRRLVKNRRIFGVVPLEILEQLDGQPVDTNQCICAIHLGGTRVRIKEGFKEEDFDMYYEEGEIKG